MIFLHLTYLEGGLFAWGETELQAHSYWPYAISEERLHASLTQLGIQFVDPRVLTASFPACGGKAVPSSGIFGELPKQCHGAKLIRWKVPAVRIEKASLSGLLSVTDTRIDDGFFYGKDVLYWSQPARFVRHLIYHQKFLPWLRNDEAVWMPVLTGEDQVLFDALSAGMPHFCRAFSGEDSSDAVLFKFISFLMDQSIRDSASRDPLSTVTVQDRWLAALHRDNRRVDATKGELQAFERDLQSWTEPLLRMTNFKYRLAFRLEEPTVKKDYWFVRYFLQRQDDPSLLISASRLWSRKKSARQVFKDDFDRAQQNLLTGLVQAGRIDPYIQMSLHGEYPDGYETDHKGAWEFLDTKAWILQDSGYGVLLPSWWGRKKGAFRLRLKGRARSRTKKAFSGVGADVLVDFDWKFAVGGEEITYKELMALARLKQPLVKFRGRWIVLRPEEIASAMQFWKEKQKQTGDLFDLLKLSIGAQQIGGLPVEGVEAQGWVADFLVNFKEHSQYKLISVPELFQGELRPYQHRGYSWLEFMKTFGIGACLADDMGLGKTIQTIVLILKDMAAKADKPVLIICPTSVVGNWQRELARFAPALHVVVHHGVSRRKGEEFLQVLQENNVIISSYALLLRDFETFRLVEWRGVILDEAQNIKNAETKQARAARTLVADYRIALTGTPVENHIGELWSIMEFLNRGLLGRKEDFTRRYFVPIHKDGDPDALEELRRLTNPFILRRLKSDSEIISDLPKKMEMKVFCNLTVEQASLYAAAVRELEKEIDELEGIQRKGKILATLTKLKQICNHPAHFLRDGSQLPGRSGKLARLTEMMEEILQMNEKTLIFTQYAEMGNLLRAHLQNHFGREAAFLHGGVLRKKREEMVERFQDSKDGPPVFILSLKAGGTGLNLTAANHVFHFDRWWNPAVEDQATDRAFRIGQKKNVQVHKLVCVGTLEERIDQILETKKQLADSVIGAGEAWLTELSTDEIKSLIALGQDAVAV